MRLWIYSASATVILLIVAYLTRRRDDEPTFEQWKALIPPRSEAERRRDVYAQGPR